MKIIQTIGAWLVLSSKDSNKLSTTVKGSMVFAVITMIAPLIGVEGIEAATDSGVNFIVALGQLVSAGMALWGAVRKVGKTLGGTNAVLNDPLI